MKKKRRSDIAFENALLECLKNTTIDKIRIEELCDVSGYSRACFYQNYGNKENLCRFIIENEAEKYQDMLVVSAINPYDPENIEESIEGVAEYFDYVKQHALLYSYIVNNSFGIDAFNAFVEKLPYNQEAAIAVSKCQAPADKVSVYCHAIQKYLYGTAFSMMRRWILNDFNIPRKDLRAICHYTIYLPYYRETRDL